MCINGRKNDACCKFYLFACPPDLTSNHDFLSSLLCALSLAVEAMGEASLNMCADLGSAGMFSDPSWVSMGVFCAGNNRL